MLSPDAESLGMCSPMQTPASGLSPESIEHLIFTIRGRRVIPDADLAHLYGVPTRRFNEAFKRNRNRFPGDFAFQLTAGELVKLRARSMSPDTQAAGRLDIVAEPVANCDRFRGDDPDRGHEDGSVTICDRRPETP
jgi:hypothetical protein